MVQEMVQEANGLVQATVILAEFIGIGGTVLYATRGFGLVLDSQMDKGKARKRVHPKGLIVYRCLFCNGYHGGKRQKAQT